jgi:hypothetical protein
VTVVARHPQREHAGIVEEHRDAGAPEGKAAPSAETAMNIPSQRHLQVPHGRFIVRVIVVFVVLLVCVATLSILDQWRTQGEMGAVLSAFFSDKVLHNVQDRGAGPAIQIVIVRESRNLWDRNTFPPHQLFDRESSFSQSSATTRGSFYLSNAFSKDIQTPLHLPGGVPCFFIYWREVRGNNPNEFRARFPNNFGYFVFSHVGLNLSKTQAIVYVDHYCGGLCGGGGYFLMRKVNGVWHVVDEHITWVA